MHSVHSIVEIVDLFYPKKEGRFSDESEDVEGKALECGDSRSVKTRHIRCGC